MSNFKIFILVLCLLVASCFPKVENIDPPTYKTMVIDSCEYIYYSVAAQHVGLTHKGNCRYCTQRRMIPSPSYQVSNEGKNWEDYRPKFLDHE